MSTYEVTITVEAEDQHDAYNQVYATGKPKKIELKRLDEGQIRTFGDASERFVEEQISTDE